MRPFLFLRNYQSAVNLNYENNKQLNYIIMKYRIKKTNEIVDVISFSCPLGTNRDSRDSVTYYSNEDTVTSKGSNIYLDFEPIEENDEIWESFRREASLKILASNMSNVNLSIDVPDFQIKGAIRAADKLIEFLKKYKIGEL